MKGYGFFNSENKSIYYSFKIEKSKQSHIGAYFYMFLRII